MGRERGFTITELLVAVAIVGVLAMIAGVGFSRYRYQAKAAEATGNVAKLGRAAAQRYSTRQFTAGVNSFGDDERGVRVFCRSSTAVPTAIASVTKRAYQSSASDWATGDVTTGWTCLRFTITQPQFYQYQYTATVGAGTTVSPHRFTAIANGDLDGDGAIASFQLSGQVIGNDVQLAPSVNDMSNGAN